MTDESKTFLLSIIITCHAIFAAYWLYYFVLEMRSTIRKRLPKLYIVIFMCCRRRQYENEQRVEEYLSKINPFLTNFEQVLICK